MANTELLHWAETYGRSSLALGPRYSPTVTRKDSTYYAPIPPALKQELVSLPTIRMSVALVTPESGLALEGTMMTPTRVVTKLNTGEIMATSSSKQWDTSWFNKCRNSQRNCLQTDLTTGRNGL